MKSLMLSILFLSVFGTAIAASQEACPMCHKQFNSTSRVLEHIQTSCETITMLEDTKTLHEQQRQFNNKAQVFLTEVHHYLYHPAIKRTYYNDRKAQSLLMHLLQQPMCKPFISCVAQRFLDQIAPQDLSSYVD